MAASIDVTRFIENDDGSPGGSDRDKETTLRGLHKALSTEFDKIDADMKAAIDAALRAHGEMEGMCKVCKK